MSSRPPRATSSVSAGAAPSGPSARSEGPDLLSVTQSATLKDAIGALLRSDEAMLRSSVFPILASTQPDEAVLSALSRNNDPRHPSNYFQRSAPSPRQQVRSVTYLPLLAAGPEDTATWTRGTNGPQEKPPASAWDATRLRSATFKADPNEAHRQVRRVAFLYEPAVFERDVLDSFLRSYYGGDDDNDNNNNTPGPASVLTGVDVTVEVLNQPSYVVSPMVIVLTASSANRQHDRALQFLFPALFGGPAPLSSLGKSRLLVDPVDIHHLGPAVPDDPRDVFPDMPYQEYGGHLKNAAACRAYFYWLRWAVYAAASSSNTSNVQAHFRLVPESDEGRVIYGRVSVYVADPDEAIRGLTPKDVRELPVFPPLPPPGLDDLGSAAADRGGPSPEDEDKDDEQRPAKARRLERAEPVLGLEGITLLQRGEDYDKACVQYASYKGSHETKNFRPFFVARPKDESEVIRVVRFAIQNGKRVVTRSGGHQYCGFSSGDERYVQIVMDDFMKNQDIKVYSEKADDVRRRGCSLVSPDSDGKQSFVELAPRFLLKDVSATLVDKGLTIPHGECPRVGIGGHVQTGGYGHQMRGLGLCLDYVYSFDIVVAAKFKDPNSVRKVTVYRPELKGPQKDSWNDKLYKGVLGGSPGAFGVITKIVFLAAHDKDPKWSQSRNVQKVYPYQGRDVEDVVAQVVRTMLKYASPSGPKLCEGLDVFVSIVSIDVPMGLFDLGIVVPELAYTGSDFSDDVNKQMKEILDACGMKDILSIGSLPLGQPLDFRPPSAVAHAGVRTEGLAGGVTKKGREFNHPYKKRVNVMLDTSSMSAADTFKFAQEFSKLASQVVIDRDLLLVIQMNMGGGRVVTNDKDQRTGLPYRNQSFGFVFDVFYTKERAKARAEAIQDSLQSLLDEVGGGFNHRLLWGSFGRESGETDMTQEKVRKLYYENESKYRDLQLIKNLVDPTNIFTTEFTVQKSPGLNS